MLIDKKNLLIYSASYISTVIIYNAVRKFLEGFNLANLLVILENWI